MSLILLGAPLGNPGDASERLKEVLASADVVAAEDTRRLARLTATLGIVVTGRVISYFEGNERHKTADLVAAMRKGANVALITDGGMPSVSDPGFRLVRAAIDAGVPVTSAPGPSAVTTALALSGLASDRFCFEGFLPRKRGERRTLLAELAKEPRTIVLFEAPHRVGDTLADLAQLLGHDRPAALCRELTKTYEEIRRATLGELVDLAVADPPRGEITLVIGGAPAAAESLSEQDLASEVRSLVLEGVPKKNAIAEVARHLGVPKRAVYEAVLREPIPSGPSGSVRDRDHPDQHD